METKQIFLLSILLVLLIVSMVAFFAGGREQTPPPVPMPSPDEAGEAGGVPLETRTVTLYFLSEDDFLLHPETREIASRPEAVLEVRQILEELIRGSSHGALSPMPSGTRLREVYISIEGIAYVDFSREFRDNHPSGSSAEVATVFAVVNALTRNVKAVRRVFILIDGTERETLHGHVDLTRPLLPRLDLIAD